MNPLNPLVAVAEILILLGLAFGLGRMVVWLQYRRRIQEQRRTILTLEGELNRINRIDSD